MKKYARRVTRRRGGRGHGHGHGRVGHRDTRHNRR